MKAQLKCGNIEQAVIISKSFNKQASTKEKIEPMDVQNFRQEMSFAEGFRIRGEFFYSAKRLDLICSRYQSIAGEASEFYLYCLRRGALSAFVDFLNVNKKLKMHV